MVTAGPSRVVKYVYALCEPCDEFKPRYVGITRNPKRRYAEHPKNPTTKTLGEWLASVGNRPRMAILEVVDSWQWGGLQEEEWWIQYLLSLGHALLNQEGVINWPEHLHEREVKRQAANSIKRMFTKQYHATTPKPNRSRQITAHGKTLTQSGWAKELGISRQAVHLRLKKHPPEVALATSCESRQPHV